MTQGHHRRLQVPAQARRYDRATNTPCLRPGRTARHGAGSARSSPVHTTRAFPVDRGLASLSVRLPVCYLLVSAERDLAAAEILLLTPEVAGPAAQALNAIEVDIESTPVTITSGTDTPTTVPLEDRADITTCPRCTDNTPAVPPGLLRSDPASVLSQAAIIVHARVPAGSLIHADVTYGTCVIDGHVSQADLTWGHGHVSIDTADSLYALSHSSTILVRHTRTGTLHSCCGDLDVTTATTLNTHTCCGATRIHDAEDVVVTSEHGTVRLDPDLVTKGRILAGCGTIHAAPLLSRRRFPHHRSIACDHRPTTTTPAGHAPTAPETPKAPGTYR